jgi:glycosyltransferase involved in cell wall biosynthesis
MVRISVIIPAYNAAKTIEETIQSVFAQTFQNFEIILVDDGSFDDTLRVLERFIDPRLHIFSFANAGVSVSRNRGTKLACGEFIAFLDADDLWTPCKLALQLEALEANPRASLAYSWVDCIDSEGNLTGGGARIQETENLYRTLLLANILQTASNPLIRRSALAESLGFDETLSGGEEWELYLRISRHHSASVVSKVQIFYRQHPNSSSTNLTRMERDSLIVIQRAFTQAPAQAKNLKALSLANFYRYLTWKALEPCPEHTCSRKTILYFLLVLRYDPTMFRHPKILLSVLCEIMLGVLPFRYWRQQWVSIQKKWALPKGKTLLECIQLQPTTY